MKPIAKRQTAVEQISAHFPAGAKPSVVQVMHLVRERGFRCNNLFERLDGQWQCNLRHRDTGLFHAFAFGPSMGEAALAALLEAVKGAPVAGISSAAAVGSTSEALRETESVVRVTPFVASSAADLDDDLLGSAAADQDIDDLLG
jgi:hypothetical protein